MSYEDPFDAAPAQPAPAPVPEPAPAAPPAPVAAAPAAAAPVVVASGGSGDLSVTFKGDGTYASPWIVPKYASVADALVDLGADPNEVAGLNQAQRWGALFERATKMAAHFAGLGSPAPTPGGGGSAPATQRQAAPAAAQAAPNGEEKFCQHGKMEYKSGTSKKTGKPYALFSCTAPRDQQCDAQWPSK
ncbi:hypothetical protein PBI_SHEAKEIRA_49 [Mycobacterium phage SheaKeira]|nr:hypothetical protein PBI_SHEAKEIRA_49 [Mycobacterium phage SheaKeira]